MLWTSSGSPMLRFFLLFAANYTSASDQTNCRLNRERHQKAQKSLKRRKGRQKQKITIRWVGSDLFFFKSILIFKVEFKFVHIKEEVPRRVSTVVESSVIMLSRGMLSSASEIEKKVSSNLNSSTMRRLTLSHNCAGQRQIECRHRRQETWRPSPSYKPGSSTTLQRWRKVSTVGIILKDGNHLHYTNSYAASESKYCGDDSKSRIATIYITIDRLQTVDGRVVHHRVKCPHPRSIQRWANYLGAVYVGWSHHCTMATFLSI